MAIIQHSCRGSDYLLQSFSTVAINRGCIRHLTAFCLPNIQNCSNGTTQIALDEWSLIGRIVAFLFLFPYLQDISGLMVTQIPVRVPNEEMQ